MFDRWRPEIAEILRRHLPVGLHTGQLMAAVAAFLLPLALYPLAAVDSRALRWQRVEAWPGDHTVVQVIGCPSPQGDRLYAVGAVSGLFRSLDGGESWASIGLGLPRDPFGMLRIRTLAINPQDEDELYVVLASLSTTPRPMVYWTEDGGYHWRARSTLGPKRIVAIGFGPTGEDLFLVSGAELFAGYRQLGGERHFVRDEQDLIANTITSLDPRIEITAFVVSSSGSVAYDALSFYLGTAGNGLLVFHKESPDGASWVQPVGDEVSQYVRSRATVYSICVHPHDPARVYVGTGSGLYVSLDAGQRWQPL
ncbi:MAG: hypothetical protein H5T69_18380, partial [Chloroflexi bacterium]|nr:hypothetical protein [Chloroflexota bacterium]